MRKRAVITGAGVVSPNGIGIEDFWCNTADGVPAVRTVTAFDVSKFNSQIAAQVLGFEPDEFGLDQDAVERMDRYVQFAMAGAQMAVQDAALDFEKLDTDRVGVVLANAICGTKYMEEEFLQVTNNGRTAINPALARPYLYDASMFNTPSSEIAARYGLHGACLTVSTGCTAGTDSVGLAYEMVLDGKLDVVITGAAEGPLTPVTFGAFDVVGVLSTHNDSPQKASRPFDAQRNGFVISEGCGILVVEELEHAMRRAARIYCEVVGYGTCNNAYHMTDLPADGAAMAHCVNLALEDAGLPAGEIDYVNAHGSSTRQNDVFETNGYKLVFGERAYEIPISSLKSMIGHPLAAANAIELVESALIFQRNYLPPTINQEEADPECDLDYVANEGREGRPDYILKTSSGFSGIHSAMILRRWEGN